MATLAGTLGGSDQFKFIDRKNPQAGYINPQGVTTVPGKPPGIGRGGQMKTREDHKAYWDWRKKGGRTKTEQQAIHEPRRPQRPMYGMPGMGGGMPGMGGGMPGMGGFPGMGGMPGGQQPLGPPPTTSPSPSRSQTPKVQGAVQPPSPGASAGFSGGGGGTQAFRPPSGGGSGAKMGQGGGSAGRTRWTYGLRT